MNVDEMLIMYTGLERLVKEVRVGNTDLGYLYVFSHRIGEQV